MSTQEITEIRNGRVSVHRVGPCVGLSAAILWSAGVAFVVTMVAVASPNWQGFGIYNVGLWKSCRNHVCVNISLLSGPGKDH